MIKNKIYITLLSILSISNIITASMLHKSLEYIDKPASKAAVRKSLGTSAEKAEERAKLRTGGISNVDLPRIADEYWRKITRNDGKFIDLINDETREKGYKSSGLLSEDIKEIEAFIRRFFLSSPSERGPVQHEYLELAASKLPKFLEGEYEHKTYEIIESVLDSDDYSSMGPKEIRVDVADYLFQKFNKAQEYNPGKRYLFLLKNSSSNYPDTFKREIKRILNSVESQVEYVGSEDLKIDFNILYLVIRAHDLNTYNDKLETILQSDQVNPDLKVIIGFDDQDIQTPISVKVSKRVENIVIIGRNITVIKDLFFLYSNLESIDLSPLSNITHIGTHFLFGCSKLERIDLSPLSNVKYIEPGFLFACSGLTSIDLTPLSNVVFLPNHFLDGCSKLKNIDLSPLSNLKHIRDGFLFNCSGLTSIDLTPLSNVVFVGYFFLDGCDNLEHIKMTKKFRDLLPKNFFEKFPKLKVENIEIVDNQDATKVSCSCCCIQ